MPNISAPGSYGGGDYVLTSNIVVTAATALSFSANARLDLNGMSIICNGNGNANTFGVICAGTLALYDSSGGAGKITGFRCGAKAEGVNSTVSGIDLSGNRYMGAWLNGSDSEVVGCLIADIAGVTDEAYAIGVQVGANGIAVRRSVFRNLYRQAGYSGSAAGEGVGVNLTTATSGGLVEDCLFDNDVAALNTYGVFAGGAGNRVNRNRFRNMWRSAAMSSAGAPEAKHNVAVLESPLTGSSGIGCETSNQDAVAFNIVAGCDVPYYGGTPVTKNVAMGFEGFPEPEPTVFGAALEQVLGGSFGNVDGKTVRVTVASAALELPPGPVSKIKVTLSGHAAESNTYSKLYCGHSAGGDDAADLVQLKVGGASSWVVPPGGEVVAEADFNYDKSRGLVFSSYHNGGAASDRLPADVAFPAATTYHKYGDVAASQTVSGFSAIANYLSGISKIELDGFPSP